MSKQDIATQVRTFLDAGDQGDDFDAEGIVDEIGERYGFDVSINDIEPAEWTKILRNHS
jgi:hypothetical protein